MSLLAPLFLAGAAAIGLPVLAHLIRRRPRGQTAFSSLMFLRPSPPRLTRRSRLDQWPLLLVRSLVILLLAVAFARPFWRSAADAAPGVVGQRVVLLIDTSASLRRGGLWAESLRTAEAVLDGLDPADRLAVVAFDRGPRIVAGFDETDRLSAAQRRDTALDRIRSMRPTWHATDLGTALTFAAELTAGYEPPDSVEADRIEADAVKAGVDTDIEAGPDETRRAAAADPGQLVLISDLQSGSQVESLQAFAWPKDLRVDVRRVEPPRPGNANARILRPADGQADTERTAEASTDSDVTPTGPAATRDRTQRTRVRVANSDNADTARFRLSWGSGEGSLREASTVPVQVPPGETRVVRMPPAEATDTSLILRGDADDFDNVRYFVRSEPRPQTVPFIGPESANDGPRSQDLGPFYYLSRLPLGDRQRPIQVKRFEPAEIDLGWDPDEVPLVVVAGPLASDHADRLAAYLDAGGHVLAVITSAMADDGGAATLRRISGDDAVRVAESDVNDYAMLSKIDFRNRAFSALADPQFNDFSQIRFWAHRDVTPGDEAWDIPATFDDAAAAILERPVGEGMLTVITSGWHPEDSQFALSTKFLPWMTGLLKPETASAESSYLVGDEIGDPPFATARLLDPDGERLAGESPDEATESGEEPTATRGRFERPGIHVWLAGDERHPLAVNLDESESRTEPMSEQVLERYGVSLGETVSAGERQERARQLRDRELESRQGLWQWLLAAALALLGLEAWLGGSLAGRSNAPPEAAINA